jgi:hypothetical protein
MNATIITMCERSSAAYRDSSARGGRAASHDSGRPLDGCAEGGIFAPNLVALSESSVEIARR